MTLNNSGQTAFRTLFLEPGQLASVGIIRAHGMEQILLARSGQSAPDGNGVFTNFDVPALNEAGQVLIVARHTGVVLGDDSSILRSDGTTLVQIARRGQTAPDGNGRFVSFLNSAILNNMGEVAFKAALTDVVGEATQRIYRSDGVELTELVRRGESAPDGNGSLFQFSSLSFNDAGQVGFEAVLTGTTGDLSDNEGIYLFDDSLGLIQIARHGDPFLGSTISNLDFRSKLGVGEEYGGLNETGITRISYWFALADGRQGIAVWTDTVAGDFNGDGMVNAADYTVWRNGLGTRFAAGDYETWRENYGEMASWVTEGGGAALSLVPEPSGLLLVAMAAVRLVGRRPPRRR